MTSGLARSQAAGGASTIRPSRKVALKGLPGAAVTASTGVDFAPETLESLIQSGDLPWREISIHVASHPDRALLVKELTRLSEVASHVEVRYKAKKLLARLGGATVPGVAPSSTPAEAPMIGELAGSLAAAEPEARLRILRAFAEARGADGADEFIACLHHQSDGTLIASALAAFARIGEARHIEALRFFLKHPSDRVVAGAVEAVGRIDPEGAFAVVLPVILREDNRVRANVLMVLYRYQKWTVLANIQRMGRSRNESYRASALWCYSQIRDEDVDEMVLAMLEVEESPELLEKEVELLCRIGTHRVVPGLTALTTLPGRREIARQVLARIAMREEAAATAARSGERKAISTERKVVSSERRPISSERRPVSSERRALSTARVKPVDASGVPAWVRPLAAILVLLSLALVRALVPSTPRAEVTEVTKSAPKVSARRAWIESDRAPAPAGPTQRILGRVVGVRGDYVLVKKDGLLYACRRAGGEGWEALESGQELLVTGRIAGWDHEHGYYRVEVASEGAD